jgi:hypothetical protein
MMDDLKARVEYNAHHIESHRFQCDFSAVHVLGGRPAKHPALALIDGLLRFSILSRRPRLHFHKYDLLPVPADKVCFAALVSGSPVARDHTKALPLQITMGQIFTPHALRQRHRDLRLYVTLVTKIVKALANGDQQRTYCATYRTFSRTNSIDLPRTTKHR